MNEQLGSRGTVLDGGGDAFLGGRAPSTASAFYAALSLTLLATALRVAWAVKVPTIPVGDFAMYRESANYLAEHGRLDGGFIYMPGLVLLLAAVHALGGEILAAKLMGALFGGLAAAPIYVLTSQVARATSQVTRAGLPLARVPSQVRCEGVPSQVRCEGVPSQVRCEGVPSQVRCEGGPKRDRGGEARQHRWVAAAQMFTVSPAAFVATLLYAVWPAGIALASVIGTDVPAGALLLLAFALLFGWGRSRPLLATVAFGAVMGVAAYFRAVALPLGVLAAGYWWSARAGARAVVTRTALALAVTLVVLSPWAVHNLRDNGELRFTDNHGGITALMGNYPNSEGTYSRSLNLMFRELEGGRTFLSEPHRETDQIAYALAKRWMRFQPGWTAGMMALRLERLFAPERGLLYWSVYRPGVLPRHIADWFGVWRPEIVGIVDGYYLVFAGLVVAGIGFSIAERRWVMAVPVACGLMLVATYALYVAEPRYRLTTEMLLFPAAGLGLARLARTLGRVGMGAFAALRRRSPWHALAPSRLERRGLALTALIAVGVVLGGVLVVGGGQALRDRYRWAVTLWQVDGQPRMALWRRAPGVHGTSPVRGLAGGAELVLAPGQTETAAEVVLPDVGPVVRSEVAVVGPLVRSEVAVATTGSVAHSGPGVPSRPVVPSQVAIPPGGREWNARLSWRRDGDSAARLIVGSADFGPDAGLAQAVVAAPVNGPLMVTLQLRAPRPSTVGAAVTAGDVTLETRTPP